LFTPATIVVAIKAAFALAKDWKYFFFFILFFY
jgi:hypothetical protein